MIRRRHSARCLALATTLVVVALPGAAAQTLDRSRPPASAPAAPYTFPKVQTRTLPNGLRLILIEDHALPLVAVRAVVGVDSLNDPVGKEGLYVLTTGMLREGTTSMTAEQLSSASSALGNVVLPLRFTTISQNFERSLALMADMLAHPAFPQPALDRLKATLAATQQRFLQAAATVPNKIFLVQLFGSDHPLARATSALDASTASITRDELQHFHETFFRPNNTTLIVVGDVREQDAVAAVASSFGSWERGSVPKASVPPTRTPPPTTIYLLDRPGVAQTNVVVGTLGPPRSSPDFAALEVMAPILGASGGSRLYQNLRERHGYMYSGTPAAVVWRREPMPSVIYGSAVVNAEKTDSALIEWLGELRGIRQRPPTYQEMMLARGSLTDALPVQMETDDLVANRVLSMVQNGVPLDFYNSYGTRIAAVTPAAVSAAAARYLDLGHLVIVVAGDRKVIEAGLRAANIGPIVIVNESGKP